MIEKLILYKTLREDELVKQFISLNTGEKSSIDQQERYRRMAECVEGLICFAYRHGFQGNLWQGYITFLLINDENPYSLFCERNTSAAGSLARLAVQDMDIVHELLHVEAMSFQAEWMAAMWQDIVDFKLPEAGMGECNSIVREAIDDLSRQIVQAADAEALTEKITRFYQSFGVGKLGLNQAFGMQAEEAGLCLCPIKNITKVRLSDLVGYEAAKKKLVRNTESFLRGQKANNCLLYGDAGTGKSTSIKALLNQYYTSGLRVIEVYKHQFRDLGKLLAQIQDRNYSFILYMDDLSFEEFEIEYKYLKAVIEGGLQRRPENVLIYATSNRRHLVKEFFSDKEGRRDQLHASDTVQEKLSLAGRFGVTIFFGAPDKNEYQNIVKVLAEKHGIRMDEEQLLLEAGKWELGHGGFSGRTAQQFIDFLAGMES